MPDTLVSNIPGTKFRSQQVQCSKQHRFTTSNSFTNPKRIDVLTRSNDIPTSPECLSTRDEETERGIDKDRWRRDKKANCFRVENNLFQFGRGKLILLDQDALYRELKELVLSVSRGGV